MEVVQVDVLIAAKHSPILQSASCGWMTSQMKTDHSPAFWDSI